MSRDEVLRTGEEFEFSIGIGPTAIIPFTEDDRRSPGDAEGGQLGGGAGP